MSSDPILDRVSAAVAAGRPRDAIDILMAERPVVTPALAIVAAEAWAAVGAERRGTALLLVAARRHPTAQDVAIEAARALLRRGAHLRARRILERHPTAAPVLVAVAWGASPPPLGGDLAADIDRALATTTTTPALLALLDRAPTSSRLRIAVASRHLAEGAADLARAVLRAGAKGREDARLDLALAFLAFDEGAFDEAAVVLSRARARFPRLSRDPSLTALVAMITVAAGRRQDAISLLHGSTARGPVPALQALLTASTTPAKATASPATPTPPPAPPPAPAPRSAPATPKAPAPAMPAVSAMPAVAPLPPRAPAATMPSVAVPPVAAPAVAVPPVAAPPVAAPPVAAPPVAAPRVAAPPVAAPPVAAPPVAAPPVAVPPVAVPPATMSAPAPAPPPVVTAPPPSMPTVPAPAAARTPAEPVVASATPTPTAAVPAPPATPEPATTTTTTTTTAPTSPEPTQAALAPPPEPAQPAPATTAPAVPPPATTPEPEAAPATPPEPAHAAPATMAEAAPAPSPEAPQDAPPPATAEPTVAATGAAPAKGPSPTWRRPHERVVEEPRSSPVAAIAVVALVLLGIGLVALPRLRGAPAVVDAGPSDVVEAPGPARQTEPTAFAARLTTCGLKVEPWVDVGITPSAWAVAAAGGRWEERPISVGRRPVPVNADIVAGIRILPARTSGRVDPIVVVDPEGSRVLGLGLQAMSPTNRPSVKDVVGSLAFGSAIPRACEFADAGSTCVVGTASCEQLQFHVQGICLTASATTAGLPGCALDVVYVVDPTVAAKVSAP